MSKKKWILLIIVLSFITYLIISKIYPGVGTSIDNLVGPTVSGFFGSIYTAIVTNPTWMTYDIYFTFASGIILTVLIMWQGHNVYNKVRQTAARSAVKEAYGYQTVPSAQPMAIPQQQSTMPQPIGQPTIQPMPPQQQPQPPPQEQPKQ